MRPHSNQPILILDDSDDDFEAMERGLCRGGQFDNPLLRFDTAEAALDYLHRRGAYVGMPDSPLPALVLLDLNMPGKGGLYFLKEVKAAEGLAKVPVVVLTTSDNAADIDRCYGAGANTYIQKPVDLDSFMSALRVLQHYWLELALVPGAR